MTGVLDGDKRGPALRNRLEGEAIHNRLLDRDCLKDLNNGVKYFKSLLRPLVVKGAANVFLYRFQQFMKLHRGNGDMFRWITRFQLSVQRMQEARNDTYLPIADPNNAERGRDQHARTIPITAKLVALIFVSLSGLTQDQRQVLTSLMAHRNRVLADYRLSELREVYLEIFCTTKTSVDNPLLAPSGHGGLKTFLVIQEGYLDNQEGYWVEVEEDGAEGFLEADEDAFWVYDEENYTWFQRRFQGRKMERGFKGRRKGVLCSQGQGKERKEGQRKELRNLPMLPRAALDSTAAATTFFVDHSNFYNLSFMATENHEAFITQPLTPTSMVLDLGCTRVMTSRVAAQDMMKFCDQNKDCGIWYHTAETQSQFTCTNSESTKCKQKLIICMYDREYSVQSNEFDIVEQGHMPTLMFGKFNKSSFLTYFSHYEYRKTIMEFSKEKDRYSRGDYLPEHVRKEVYPSQEDVPDVSSLDDSKKKSEGAWVRGETWSRSVARCGNSSQIRGRVEENSRVVNFLFFGHDDAT
ncbi:hypothetical protein AK812_SmicGene14698 [Symbiodinium microadriaticum]|uniref:Uncharacterized protein n=1 Tax=Symbiodinium microadriaticum TaxID=2951 RepID=A0A1Q9E4W5_SYMMI|nr:hypothetical protein AK812_SmicGene14698 [Symbiodinium microadriaticum]